MTRRLLAALGGIPPSSIPLIVFVVALVLRVGLQWAVGFYDPGPQRWEYDVIARNIAEGRGYYYDHPLLGTRWYTHGLPTLPLLDAAFYLISGGTDRFLLIGLALAAFSAGTAAIASLVALRLDGRVAATIAGAAVAFHPGLLVYSSQIHEHALETFAVGVALVAFLAELRRPTGRSLIAAAAGASLATLVRPTYAAFVLAALGVLVARRWPRALPRALVILLAIAAATAPWTIRNAVVLGPAASGLGPYSCFTLWIGNNPYATGSAVAPDGRSWWDVQPPPVRAEIYGRPEIEQGRIFCEQMAAFLTADPLRSVGWWMTKWTWYWWISPQAGQFYPSLGLRLYLGAWLAAAALALLGALELWRKGRRWELAIFVALFLPISLAQSFAYVEGRHRLEIEWAVLVLSAVGATVIGSAVLRRLGAQGSATPRGASTST